MVHNSSVHSISTKVIADNLGIKTIVCSNYQVSCLSTPTGIKFLATCDLQHHNPEEVLSRVYLSYAQWVMKNPFYSPEMPIRLPTFDDSLRAICSQSNIVSGKKT